MVTNALLSHSGDLRELSIISSNEDYSYPQLNYWVDYAAAHNVQNLSIYIRGGGTLASLFSCTSLVSLYLGGIRVKNRPRNNPTPASEFSFLSSCHLENLDDEIMGLLLSKCPVLETLELFDFCVLSKCAEVSSESLLVLIIEVSEKSEENFELKFQCPNLEEMRVSKCRPCELQLECEKKMGPPSLPTFDLCWEFPDEAVRSVYQFHTTVNMSWEDGKLSNLKTLVLSDLVTSTVWDMLMHLPKLESLTLSNCAFLQDVGSGERIMQAAMEVNLREAHVKLEKETAGDLVLLRLLTSKCPMLHTMVVTLKRQILQNDGTYLKVLRELFTLNSPRKRACLREIERLGSVVKAIIKIKNYKGAFLMSD